MANEANEKNKDTEVKHEQDTVYVDDKNLDIVLSTKPIGTFKLFWREIKADPIALVSLILLVVIFLTVYIGAAIVESQMNPMQTNLIQQNQSPGNLREFQQTNFGQDSGWFRTSLGTDSGGRYLAPLTLVGARNSLNIGLSVAALSFIIGIAIGVVSGFFGGKVDFILMRFTDTVFMIPFLMIAIVLITILDRTMWNFIWILTAFSWMGRARLIRAASLQNRNLDYVSASKTLGTKNSVIIVREMLPNMVDVIVANFVLTVAASIGIETGLTILGFGLGIEHPSIGFLITNALAPVNLTFFQWTWAFAIGLVILIMLCINFVGNALQRVADPRQRLV